MLTTVFIPAVILLLLAATVAVLLWAAGRHRSRRIVHLGPSHDVLAADLENRVAEHHRAL